MKTHHKILCAALATQILSSVSFPAAANDTERINELERKVSEMQAKIDLLMQAVNTKGDTPGSTFKAAPVTPVNPRLTLNLGVVSYQDLATNQIPSDPGSLVVASEVVDNAGDFSGSRFYEVPSMRSYADLKGQFAGQYWTGTLKIPESGTINFVSEMQAYGNYPYVCDSKLLIDGQLVLSANATGIHGTSIGKGTANLSQGPHKFGYWTFCGNKYEKTTYKRLNFALRMKLPSDVGPKPIPSELYSPD